MTRAVRRALLPGLAAAALVAAAPAGAAVPSLNGEALEAEHMWIPGNPSYGSLDVTGSCSTTGEPSTYDYVSTGDARGPYPGTYVERGTLTLTRSLQGQWRVTGFHSTFEIDSQAGQVIGTKTFSHSGDNNCSGAMPGGFLSAEAFASWDARITAGGRAYADSGTGFSSLHDHTGSTTRTMHFLGRLTSSRTEATPLDAEPPAISVTRPAEGASYLLGEPVTAAFSCDDGATGAGVSSCVGSVADGAALDTSSVGPKTFHVSARDNAGNASEKDVHYSVVWPFEGFFSPVNNQPTLNRVNAGRAIPIKFSLGGDRGLGVLADGYPKSQDVACDSTAPVDGVEETVSADSSGLSYDAASGRYVYVWKTDRAWAGTCRQLVLKLEDGSTHRVTFTFTD